MTGFGGAALSAAPIAGGALLGTLMGTFKGPDMREIIKSDIALLDSLPKDEVELRAELQRTINYRVYELITVVDRNRELRAVATGYQGNWRDSVLFVCALLFTVIWWNVPHDRTNWMLTFVILVILLILIGIYAARGIYASVLGWIARLRGGQHSR
jgi:hypothetical protein